MKAITTFVTAFFAFASAALAGEVVNNDGSVLRAVTTQICQSLRGKYTVVYTSSLVVDSHTTIAGINRSAVFDLVRRNTKSTNLPVNIGCEGAHVVTDADIDRAIAASTNPVRWDGFYSAFPGADGITQLSLPGYSRDGRSAVVLVSGACGVLCGAAFYWELQLRHGKWARVRTVNAWIS